MADHPVAGWDSYPLNESMPYWVLQEMPRKEARAHYERTMDAKDDRIRALKRLLAVGYGIELEPVESSIQKLNEWFVTVMTALPDRAVPNGESLAVCEDVALFLGDVMISRHPELTWEFFTWGKRDVAYQSHVIMGFPFEDPKLRTNLDLPGIIHGYGVHVLENRTGKPQRLQLPDGHPLNGVEVPVFPLKEDKFVALLHSVDRRCSNRPA